MKHNKAGVFRRLFKKDCVTVSRVSDLLKGGYLSAAALADKFVELSEKVWGEIAGGKFVWTKKMVLSHFEICPDQLYCVFNGRVLIATLTFMYAREEKLLRHETWLEKTGGGFLTTNNSAGNAAFGVDLSVSKESPSNVSNRLILSAILLDLIGRGFRAVYLGARIPTYHKYAPCMNVEDYVHGKRKSGKPLDPELYFYIKNGFEIVDIIPGYMEDPESLDYGVLIRWKNPFYRVTKILPFLKPIIRFVGKKLFLRLPETN